MFAAGNNTGVPAAMADASYRQQEAGRKEEREQARPLRGVARTTAEAAEPGAGRRAAPARRPPALPRPAPPRPRHWPVLPIGLIGRRREQVGSSGATQELAKAGARAGARARAGVGIPNLWTVRLPPSQHVELLDPDLRFLPSVRRGFPAHAPSPACPPHFTRRTSKHSRPDRPPGDGSPEAWQTALRFLGLQPSPWVPRSQLLFPITFFSQYR